MTEQISINDLVPPEHLVGQVADDYSRIRSTLEENLRNPNKIDRYAAHESGHFLYLERTKLISSPADAVFAGPTIYYQDGAIRYFVAAVTSNKVSLLDTTLVYTKSLLEKLAYVAVAGTVVERALYNTDEETEMAADGDKYMLFKHCYRAMERDQITFEGHTLWKDKYNTVTQENVGLSDNDPTMQLLKKLILVRCFGTS
jgi:hypothetical protein